MLTIAADEGGGRGGSYPDPSYKSEPVEASFTFQAQFPQGNLKTYMKSTSTLKNTFLSRILCYLSNKFKDASNFP